MGGVQACQSWAGRERFQLTGGQSVLSISRAKSEALVLQSWSPRWVIKVLCSLKMSLQCIHGEPHAPQLLLFLCLLWEENSSEGKDGVCVGAPATTRLLPGKESREEVACSAVSRFQHSQEVLSKGDVLWEHCRVILDDRHCGYC